MIEKKSTKKLTPEQRKKLRVAGLKFMLKSFWNGLQHSLMAILMNFIFSITNLLYLGGDQTVATLGCVVIWIFVLQRVFSVHEKNLLSLKESVKEITQ